jgi:hypothetical protein
LIFQDIALRQSVVSFDDLTELLGSLDELIAYHKYSIQTYGERLAALLRLQQISSGAAADKNKKQDNKQKRAQDDRDSWITFKLDGSEEAMLRIANTRVMSPASAESTALFRIIENLKERQKALESARDIIDKLPVRGISRDQKFIVIFGEGLPRQVIPTNETKASQRRFIYTEDFELKALEKLEVAQA